MSTETESGVSAFRRKAQKGNNLDFAIGEELPSAPVLETNTDPSQTDPETRPGAVRVDNAMHDISSSDEEDGDGAIGTTITRNQSTFLVQDGDVVAIPVARAVEGEEDEQGVVVG